MNNSLVKLCWAQKKIAETTNTSSFTSKPVDSEANVVALTIHKSETVFQTFIPFLLEDDVCQRMAEVTVVINLVVLTCDNLSQPMLKATVITNV